MKSREIFRVLVVIATMVLAPEIVRAQLPIGGTIGDFVNHGIREGQKGADHLGVEINKQAISVGRGVDHLGVEINEQAIEIGAGLDHFGVEVNKAANDGADSLARTFCSVFTLGGSDTGAASCSINAGVGRDNHGWYTFNPNTPETIYHGDENRPKDQSPQDKQLQEFAKFINSQLILSHEEIQAAEDLRTLKYRRYLPGGYRLGKAWPDIDKLRPPTTSGVIRGRDAGATDGGGNFLAIRYDDRDGKNRVRYHSGTDYVTKPGEDVFAPVDGYVVREQRPRKELNGLLIDHQGFSASVFYIQPSPEISAALREGKPVHIEAGEKIGTAQDITKVYGAKMTNHVHVSLRDPAGRYVSPDGKLAILPSVPISTQAVESAKVQRPSQTR